MHVIIRHAKISMSDIKLMVFLKCACVYGRLSNVIPVLLVSSFSLYSERLATVPSSLVTNPRTKEITFKMYVRDVNFKSDIKLMVFLKCCY